MQLQFVQPDKFQTQKFKRSGVKAAHFHAVEHSFKTEKGVMNRLFFHATFPNLSEYPFLALSYSLRRQSLSNYVKVG